MIANRMLKLALLALLVITGFVLFSGMKINNAGDAFLAYLAFCCGCYVLVGTRYL